MDVIAALNLSRTFEDRLLAAPAAGGRQVPCVVVSGFLGAGKSTVLAAVLRSRGNLRFAVIMNEFAGVDVDSALLGGAGTNAAVGLPLLSLPEGCCCCSGAAQLRGALQQVLGSAGNVDAVLLETTGLADPAPLAGALAKSGVALSCVACVVDAEAALAQLAGPAAATLQAQLQCADLIVLNKCDLVDLATLSEVEDTLSRWTAARVVRCRHGAVPLPALLDVQLAPQQHAAADAQHGGVVTHEASGDAVPQYVMSSGTAPKRGVKRGRDYAATPHVLELERISSVTWRSDAAPLCASAFAAWLLRAARHSKGLLRAKGTLFLAQRRRKRFVFHLSGARRVEVIESEQWEGPPECTVVLIGTSRAELVFLRDQLDGFVQTQTNDDNNGRAADAARAFAALLAAEERVGVCAPAASEAHAKDRAGCVDFLMRGMPHKGVDEASLNAKLVKRVNGADEAFMLFGVALPHAPDRLARVCLVFSGDEDAASTHKRLMLHVSAVLRDALAQIGLCDC